MSTFILSVVILSTVCSGIFAVLQTKCPPLEDSFPCYCEEDDLTTMHCTHLNESTQIHRALSRLKEYKISTVSMWMFGTGIIKSDTFRGPAVKTILFSHSFVNLENPPFLGQETHLNRVTFLACFNESRLLGSLSLGHLEKLKDVTFEKNDIKVLKNDWITSGGPSLRSVSFDNCKIEKLEDKVFSKLEALTTIYITDNKITRLTRSMFPRPAENLRSLNLNGNKIESLSDDIFEDMPSLNVVNLEGNNLQRLSESVWSSIIENLSRIYLNDNPIRCDKDLKWISQKSLPMTLTGTCSTPSELKNKALRHLLPADFH